MEGRRGDAVGLFITTVGTPQEMIDQMRKEPWWVGIEAIAPTLAYDFEVMGDSSRGDTIPAEVVGDVSVPALVLCSGASPEWMIDVGGQSQLADALPAERHGALEGQEHVVAPEVLMLMLEGFFPDSPGT